MIIEGAGGLAARGLAAGGLDVRAVPQDFWCICLIMSLIDLLLVACLIRCLGMIDCLSS